MVLPILLTVISLGAIIARAQVTRCPDYNDDEYYQDYVRDYDTYNHVPGSDHAAAATWITGCTYTILRTLPDGGYSCNTYVSYIADGYSAVDGGNWYNNVRHCPSAGNTPVWLPIPDYADLTGTGEYAWAVTEMPYAQVCAGHTTTVSIDSNTGYVTFTSHGSPTYTDIIRRSHYVTSATCPAHDAEGASPLALFFNHAGFQQSFTSLEDGVMFDMLGRGQKYKWSWTRADAAVGFIVKPNKDGKVLSAKYEMFGNFTHQIAKIGDKLGGRGSKSEGASRGGYKSNGYEALMTLCNCEIFDQLNQHWKEVGVWVNSGHDGVFKMSECKPLDYYHITSIDLSTYTESKESDHYGNTLRFRSPANAVQTDDHRVIKLADVFLISKD